MACPPKLYINTVVKKVIPPGVASSDTAAWAAADVIDFSLVLTLESNPVTTVTYGFIAGDIVESGLNLLWTIPATGSKKIQVPGKYLVSMRMTDAVGVRGLTPCPDYLEFFA